MARPRKDIDKTEFEKLCGLQCTKVEICGWFDITDKTLDAWVKRIYHTSFSDIYNQKRAVGRISLRRSQFRMASKNPTMAIWLGKQYLNQREPDHEEESKAPSINIICDIPHLSAEAVQDAGNSKAERNNSTGLLSCLLGRERGPAHVL